MANSSISSASKAFNVALAGVQKDIRDRISTSFIEVRQRYLEAEFSDKSYDSIGLSAGKFCEAVLRCLQQRLTGSHIPFGTHLKDFASECRKLEQLQSTTGPESLRVIIPGRSSLPTPSETSVVSAMSAVMLMPIEQTWVQYKRPLFGSSANLYVFFMGFRSKRRKHLLII
jgi:hypothetical protein